MFARCEQEMNYVERVKHYGELQPEADAHRSDDPEHWPIAGRIDFVDVQLRYRPDLPAVLNGLSFSIEAGEKVGIIGRTGAGKSSVVNALYRTVELSGGRIEIDGVDTKNLGLETVSTCLSRLTSASRALEHYPSGVFPIRGDCP